MSLAVRAEEAARRYTTTCPNCSKPLTLTEGGAYCRDMNCGYARGTMPVPPLGYLYALGNIPWGRLSDRHRASNNRGTERSRWER